VAHIYLASPYSHVDPARRHGRYRAACAAACWLLNIRCWVYSPIVHCHELARLHDLPGDFEFWRDYNYAMLDGAHSLYLLNIEGMTDSIGVKNEIAYARRNMKPIHLLTPHGMEYVRSDYYKEPVL
jgi:hypothetical protein